VQGGWLPLVVAGRHLCVMDTWRLGRRTHLEAMRDNALALDLFLERADKYNQRVAGTAIFLSPVWMWRPMCCFTASSTTRCCMNGW
jgi:K+ transporter